MYAQLARARARVTSLVIGASGLVGGALLRELGATAVGTYRDRAVTGLRHLDVRDQRELERVFAEARPSIVFFPAAEPNVDWCETHPDEAHALNVDTALRALALAQTQDTGFVFFSTDYVFDGEGGPYAEEAPLKPLSVYARHKVEVEEHVLAAGGTIVRTTTVFGKEVPPGKNFVLRLVARLRSGEPATIPSDQWSTPTWSDDLARAAVAVGTRGGVWHAAGPDFVARDEFARVIAEVYGLDAGLVHPVSTDTLQQAARRPARAGLISDKLRDETGVTLLPVRLALQHLRDS